MPNFATIWNTVRTFATGHPVGVIVGVSAVVGALILRITGADLKLLDAYGRLQVAEGNWAQNTASRVGEKRLAKAVTRAEKRAEKVRKHEAARVERAAQKALQAEAKARAAAAAAGQVKTA